MTNQTLSPTPTPTPSGDSNGVSYNMVMTAFSCSVAVVLFVLLPALLCILRRCYSESATDEETPLKKESPKKSPMLSSDSPIRSDKSKSRSPNETARTPRPSSPSV